MIKNVLKSLVMASLLSSCASEEHLSDNMLVVDNIPGQWTYVSLTDGKVVGYSSLTDNVADSKWAVRLDWDIAICQGVIRTNSGKSGKGIGGIAVSTHFYDEQNLEPDAHFHVDNDTVLIPVKPL